MRKMYAYWGICVILLVILVGCDDSSLHPTLPLELDTAMTQETPEKPSDDVADSDILTDPYPTIIIAAIGDSITRGDWRSNYPDMLDAKLQAEGYHTHVENGGIPGADSAMTERYFYSNAAGAQIALIMVGTNDVSCPGCCEDSYNCLTMSHIRAMVDQALASGILPILGTVTPKNPQDVYGWYNPRIEELNAEIYQLGLDYSLDVVDTYTPILEQGGALLFSDKHHLNSQGYDILAQLWHDTLIKYLTKPM